MNIILHHFRVWEWSVRLRSSEFGRSSKSISLSLYCLFSFSSIQNSTNLVAVLQSYQVSIIIEPFHFVSACFTIIIGFLSKITKFIESRCFHQKVALNVSISMHHDVRRKQREFYKAILNPQILRLRTRAVIFGRKLGRLKTIDAVCGDVWSTGILENLLPRTKSLYLVKAKNEGRTRTFLFFFFSSKR